MRYRACAWIFDPSPTVLQNKSSVTIFINCVVFMSPKRTYLPSINALAWSKAEIYRLHCSESLKHD